MRGLVSSDTLVRRRDVEALAMASVDPTDRNKVTILINKWKRYKRLTKEDMQRLFMCLTCMRIVCNSHGQYVWKEIESQVLSARRLTPQLKKRVGSPKLDEFYKVMSELLEDPAQKIVVFSQ